MKRILSLLGLVLVVCSCQAQREARVVPESLLTSSSENVSFNINDLSSIEPISNWIADDKPTEAILRCADGSSLCNEVASLLRKNGVTVNAARASGETDSVELIYDRVTARDCANRGFGCSVSVNTLQSVANRMQFIKPPLSDAHDAGKAVENYNSYFDTNR